MSSSEEELKNYRVKETRYNRILVAIDIDDFTSSDQAFDYACTLARDSNSEMGIVSILETKDINVFDSLSPDTMVDKRMSMSHDLLSYVKKANEFGVASVKPILSEGKPAKTILEEVVPTFNPDLIVVGSETKQVSGKAIGSQAEDIIKHSPVSVIVVR